MVATEMGKMAKDSGTSATEIKKTLSVIVNHLDTITIAKELENDIKI